MSGPRGGGATAPPLPGLDPLCVLVREREEIKSDFRSARSTQDRRLCRNNFQLGIWAQEWVPHNGKRGTWDSSPRKATAVALQEPLLKEYGKQAGIAAVTLRQCRDVAVAWGAHAEAIAAGRTEVEGSWRGYRELAPAENRFDLLASIVGAGQWLTLDRATAARRGDGQTVTSRRPVPKTAQDKADRVIDFMTGEDGEAVRRALIEREEKTKAAAAARKRAREVELEFQRLAQERLKAGEKARQRSDYWILTMPPKRIRELLRSSATLLAKLTLEARDVPPYEHEAVAQEIRNVLRQGQLALQAMTGELPVLDTVELGEMLALAVPIEEHKAAADTDVLDVEEVEWRP